MDDLFMVWFVLLAIIIGLLAVLIALSELVRAFTQWKERRSQQLHYLKGEQQ